MKRSTAFLLAPLFCILLNSNAALAGNEDLEAKCKEWAKEDEIPAKEMADYLKSCVADLIGKKEAGEETNASDENRQGKSD
jgi:hypothetical protein